MATNSIELYQPDAQVGELKLWRPPEKVLAEAQLVAEALHKRIANKKKPDGTSAAVIFNGQQYIENDDWQFVSNFFGYAPKVVSTEFVQFGDTKGFKAIAELINEHTGLVVGRGEAICLDEEENWGPRTKYEWQDVLVNGQKVWDPKGGKNRTGSYRRERVEVGIVTTPMFQLMSMAETRACNKAMSNKLKWVVTLAGYAATPAEDMHEATMREEKEKPIELPVEIKKKPTASVAGNATAPVKRSPTAAVEAGAGVTSSAPVSSLPSRPLSQASPQPGPAVSPRPSSQSAQPRRERVISEAQARRFYAIRKGAGWNDQETTDYLRETFGIASDREIPANRYEEACKWAEDDF